MKNGRMNHAHNPPQFIGYRRFDLASHLGFQKYAHWKMPIPGGGEDNVVAFGRWSEDTAHSAAHLRGLLETGNGRSSGLLILFPEQDALAYSHWFGSWIGSYIGPVDQNTAGSDSRWAMEEAIRRSVSSLLGVPETSVCDISLTPHLAIDEYMAMPAD